MRPSRATDGDKTRLAIIFTLVWDGQRGSCENLVSAHHIQSAIVEDRLALGGVEFNFHLLIVATKYAEVNERERRDAYLVRGQELRAIRDGRLYWLHTFEEYCEQQWELTDRRAQHSFFLPIVYRNLDSEGPQLANSSDF